MIPDLSEAVEEGSAGFMLAGCERDTKHLAMKALTFLHQVGHHSQGHRYCKIHQCSLLIKSY